VGDRGVDAARIGVLGESAGGGLAAALALVANGRPFLHDRVRRAMFGVPAAEHSGQRSEVTVVGLGRMPSSAMSTTSRTNRSVSGA